jgi:hypothetical protein
MSEFFDFSMDYTKVSMPLENGIEVLSVSRSQKKPYYNHEDPTDSSSQVQPLFLLRRPDFHVPHLWLSHQTHMYALVKPPQDIKTTKRFHGFQHVFFRSFSAWKTTTSS